MNGQMLIRKFKNGGELWIHHLYKQEGDIRLLHAVALEFARIGHIVVLIPRLHFKNELYQEIFGALIGTKYERKCPDLLVDGLICEVKNYSPPFQKSKINRMIAQALQQASRIVINNSKGCSDRYIKAMIWNHIRINHTIDEVWLYEKGKIRKVY